MRNWLTLTTRNMRVILILNNITMLETIRLDGTRQQIKIENLWIDKTKMADELQDAWAGLNDWYWQMYSGISIATDPNNENFVFVAEWKDAEIQDTIQLWAGGSMERPLTPVKALNELRVMWWEWDKIYVSAL